MAPLALLRKNHPSLDDFLIRGANIRAPHSGRIELVIQFWATYASLWPSSCLFVHLTPDGQNSLAIWQVVPPMQLAWTLFIRRACNKYACLILGGLEDQNTYINKTRITQRMVTFLLVSISSHPQKGVSLKRHAAMAVSLTKKTQPENGGF